MFFDQLSSRVKFQTLRSDKTDLRVVIEEIHLPLEFLRIHPIIVSFEHGHIGALTQGQDQIVIPGNPLVLRIQMQPDLRMRLRIFPEDIPRGIRTAVIDNHDFVREIDDLRQDGIQALPDMRLVIVGQDRDRSDNSRILRQHVQKE